ncbi:SDR family NAD(P)-dependent oxidoreductase [Roseomonas aeriglobus]|nr:SDR family NAD(P)-dependent oxidoreductase [Roseomonas aeriglobus]
MTAMNAATGPGLIIVGPGKHFGAELVRRFVAAGFRVGVVARRESSLAELRTDVGHDLLTLAADVTDTGAFEQALAELAGRLGRVDGLIYNPKASFKAAALSTDATDLGHAMAVNVTGAMVAIQTLLPWLEPRRGSVVLTGGGYKDEPDPDKLALSLGKANLHALYKALNQPLQRRGVTLKTVIIDGAVRRDEAGRGASSVLADFYWSIFEGGSGRIHRFPRDLRHLGQFKLL